MFLKVGELVGGSQREERLDVLKQRYVVLNFKMKIFSFFLFDLSSGIQLSFWKYIVLLLVVLLT